LSQQFLSAVQMIRRVKPVTRKAMQPTITSRKKCIVRPFVRTPGHEGSPGMVSDSRWYPRHHNGPHYHKGRRHCHTGGPGAGGGGVRAGGTGTGYRWSGGAQTVPVRGRGGGGRGGGRTDSEGPADAG